MVTINIPMPKNCDSCPCMVYARVTYDEIYGCVFTRKPNVMGMRTRPTDCPMVECEDYEVDDGR